MDPAIHGRPTYGAWLPRTRGDGPRFSNGILRAFTASPHTRGWTPVDSPLDAAGIGFPAHAGMDPCRRCACRFAGRLPRTRGDGPHAYTEMDIRAVASPHTRGWIQAGTISRWTVVGFPAHAGMDPRRSTLVYALAASPHTRGWTPSRRRTKTATRGFPAHGAIAVTETNDVRPLVIDQTEDELDNRFLFNTVLPALEAPQGTTADYHRDPMTPISSSMAMPIRSFNSLQRRTGDGLPRLALSKILL